MDKNILVVDDDEIILKIIVKFLNFIHVSTETVVNKKECLEKLKEKKYDLYFIDLTLPDINGVELAKLIKEKSPDSKVIIMSGYLESEIDIEYKKYYDDFIYKPDLSSQIIEKTKKILNI